MHGTELKWRWVYIAPRMLIHVGGEPKAKGYHHEQDADGNDSRYDHNRRERKRIVIVAGGPGAVAVGPRPCTCRQRASQITISDVQGRWAG